MFNVFFVCLVFFLTVSVVVSTWRAVSHIRSVRADPSYIGWSDAVGGGGDSGDGGGGGD